MSSWNMRLFAGLALGIAFVAGCDETGSVRTVTAKLNWQHSCFAEDGLKVVIDRLTDPAKYRQTVEGVAGGDAEFSLTGGSLPQARGRPLAAIANFNKRTPTTLFARKESGIVSPAGLAGKAAIKNDAWRETVGHLLGKFGLTPDDIVDVPSGFDMTPFYGGDVDVWAGLPVGLRFPVLLSSWRGTAQIESARPARLACFLLCNHQRRSRCEQSG